MIKVLIQLVLDFTEVISTHISNKKKLKGLVNEKLVSEERKRGDAFYSVQIFIIEFIS